MTTRSRRSLFNPNTNHHSPIRTITSAPALLPALFEQVPTFADDRLNVELDSKETPKEHVKISRLPLFLGTETRAWMTKAWPPALTGRRQLCRF